MSGSKKSRGRSPTEKTKIWFKPGQVARVRDVAYRIGGPYLQLRNERFDYR